ncbi:D-glucarate permease [Klebsiella michiganensis]|uniref:D-glucarate permease n=1 Tax=Klebsiella michiganensis TaxID=1134687 RepID=A0A7H4LWU0_9ENTR|nr:D-glucarate permease [Klebsiella michiganensis]
MSRIDTVVCTDARKTKYRFVVLTMIFLVYAINYADRTNIGAVLPFIIDEFHINNFEAGAIASMFFLGYAVSQIPAGFFIARRGTRGLVSLSIFGFSAFTWLMGTVSSVFGLKMVRLGLGLAKGRARWGWLQPLITGSRRKRKPRQRASTSPPPCLRR